MRTSLNPLMYKDWSFEKLYTEPGTYTLNLSPGTYQYIMRGAGGAGGNNDSSNNRKGGAGGKGELSSGTFTIDQSTLATIYVGEMGMTYANGGNGGARGDATDATVNPGAGGGGGKPSYILAGGLYYVAAGGGGGGGAGGSDTQPSRYSDGASGGGGGGYYSISVSQSTLVIYNIPGKKGGKGGMRNGAGTTSGSPGVAGNTSDFPSLYSSAGASGQQGTGGARANGGGASGGGGGPGIGNESYSHGGGGGAGAGGSLDAGGGQGGTGTNNAGNATNHHTTPTDTTEENANYGFPGNYGMGGGPNANGNSGFVFVRLLP